MSWHDALPIWRASSYGNDWGTSSGSYCNRRRLTRNQGRWCWHPLDQISRSNGYVPRRMPRLHNHDDWQMVQWRLPKIYQKTGLTIQPKCIIEDAKIRDAQSPPRSWAKDLPHGSKTAQLQGQCGNKKKFWWQFFPQSPAAFILVIQLSEADAWDIYGRSIFFADRTWGRGEYYF